MAHGGRKEPILIIHVVGNRSRKEKEEEEKRKRYIIMQNLCVLCVWDL
jgi:hypothetical protein